jgi:hypothetical protein
MAFDAKKNFAISLVATAPSPASSGTSLVVTGGDGTKFPAVPFNATIWPINTQPTTANAEIVRVTNIATDTFTITRTQESTSARSVVVGDQIMAGLTVKSLTDIETAAAVTQIASTRIGTRVTSITSSSTPSPNADTDDIFTVTALAVTATFAAPSGTPVNGQRLIIRVKDNGGPKTLAWNASYVAGGVALPTVTVTSKILTIMFIFNTDNALNKWQCIGVAQEQ